jgi:hypothetical protein
MTIVKTTIRDGRIEIPAPADFPDGTEVLVTIGNCETDEAGPLRQAEIVRILAAMRQLEPLELSETEAADLDEWERQLNQHGLDHRDSNEEYHL